MQSLKYIIPVVVVLIAISAGMYFFGDQIASSGPDADALSTVIEVSQEEGDQQVPKNYTPQESQEVPGYYDISWVDLADVDFEAKYYEDADQNLLFPTFGPRPLALKDKKIILPGYVLPTDVENEIYVLSAFTMSSCFFCGAAGPESVVQLKFKPGHREYKMDEWITFKGTLRLNDSDINSLNYIIEDAEEVEE